MKKNILILAALFSFVANYAQSDSTNFEKGIAIFEKEFEQQDYRLAVDYLEKARAESPDNPEVLYCLGYAYCRLNAKDGEQMPKMQSALSLKASALFEEVNKLSPKYEGKYFALDPYAKIMAEWSSLAMAYQVRNQQDSALWAYQEGKKRGGFSDFFLAMARKRLENCPNNTLLISAGDNITFPLYYLQNVENYRTDVKVIDLGLIQSFWYPKFLKEKQGVEYDLATSVLDTLNYTKRGTNTIENIPMSGTGKSFPWKLKPQYKGVYIRGELVLLSLIRKHAFKSPVYVCRGIYEGELFGLQDYQVARNLLVTEILPSAESQTDEKKYEWQCKEILSLIEHQNKNSRDERRFSDQLRQVILFDIDEALVANKPEKAKRLLSALEKYGKVKEFPYESSRLAQYHAQTKAKLENP